MDDLSDFARLATDSREDPKTPDADEEGADEVVDDDFGDLGDLGDLGLDDDDFGVLADKDIAGTDKYDDNDVDDLANRAVYPDPVRQVLDKRGLNPNKFTIIIYCQKAELGKGTEAKEDEEADTTGTAQPKPELVKPLHNAVVAWSRIMSSMNADGSHTPLPIASGMICYPQLVFDPLGKTDGVYSEDRSTIVDHETFYATSQSVAGIMQMGLSTDVLLNNVTLFDNLGKTISGEQHNPFQHCLVTNLDDTLIRQAFEGRNNSESSAMFCQLIPKAGGVDYRSVNIDHALTGEPITYFEDNVEVTINVDGDTFDFIVVWPGHIIGEISADQYKNYIDRQTAVGAYTYTVTGKYGESRGFDVEQGLSPGDVRVLMSDVACATYTAVSFIEMGDKAIEIVEVNE